MTPSNGNIFRVTDHLGGEFNGPLCEANPWVSGNSPKNGQLREDLMQMGYIGGCKADIDNTSRC